MFISALFADSFVRNTIFFLSCRNFFRIFKTKILYYIFLTIFIFYGALKKGRELFFAQSLLKLKLFIFSVWHFYFLRKNIWQICLFPPNSIKICREQKDLSARFSDESETVFLGRFSLLALNIFAVPPNCSLHEIL